MCIRLSFPAANASHFRIGLKPKAMNIDRMEFLAWMQRIMDRLDILYDKFRTADQQLNAIDGDELLDNQDILQMLKISNRSLQRYRSNGKLPYYTISGKLYYRLSDVHQLIRESVNHPVHRTRDNDGQ